MNGEKQQRSYVERVDRREKQRVLEQLLEEKRYVELRKELEELNEVDAALFIEDLKKDMAALAFRLLPKETAAEVFAYISPEAKAEIAEAFTDREVADMLNVLFLDDAVDFMEEMPANVVTRVLSLIEPEKRSMINHYMKFPDDSAGTIMTGEFIDFKQQMTVGAAIQHLRSFGHDKETIYTCYVTDSSRILEGVISVRELLLSKDDVQLKDIMDRNVVKAYTTDDREEVARLFHTYDFLAIPIVDTENRLVGIVTVDDAVDIMQEETTEDFEKMAAMSPSDKPYLKTPVWIHAKNRVTWLMILMLSGILNGFILERYEAAFVAMPLLVTFMPMLTDTGGNAGSQSSTMLIRGMALNEIGFSDTLRVLLKESSISLMVGAILAIFNFVRIYLTYGKINVALTVSLAMIVTVFLAQIMGGLLPLLAKKLKLDPAIMAAPLITTIVDAVSLIVYFNIANAILLGA